MLKDQLVKTSAFQFDNRVLWPEMFLGLSRPKICIMGEIFIHVQYTRTESDRLGYATVRLTGSPIARDLEKYTEVFTV